MTGCVYRYKRQSPSRGAPAAKRAVDPPVGDGYFSKLKFSTNKIMLASQAPHIRPCRRSNEEKMAA